MLFLQDKWITLVFIYYIKFHYSGKGKIPGNG
jgi:hypothetical protein